MFDYDVMGRTQHNWQCTPRTCGTSSYYLPYSYDQSGNIVTAGNGIGVNFTNTYNSAGRLTSLTSSLADSNHPGTLLSNVHYGPFGAISDSLGNQLNESLGYATRGWLQSAAAASTSTTTATGSITVTGSDQQTQSATPSSALISVGGFEQSVPYCAVWDIDGVTCDDWENRWDVGSIGVTINGSGGIAQYGSTSLANDLAQTLTNQLNGTGSLVHASNNQGEITVTSNSSGAGVNYSISYSSWEPDPTDFGSGSFAATGPANMSGGHDSSFDSGTVNATLNGTQVSSSYCGTCWNGQPSTSTSIASDLASKLAATGWVSASASGNVISLTSNTPGSSGTLSLTVSWSNSADFTASSGVTPGTGGTAYNMNIATFAPNGSVLASTDSVNGSWNYTYDEFNRLLTSNKNNGQQTFSYAYDRFGNRWQQNAPQGGPAPQYAFDTNNHLTNSGLTYDALGNVLNDGLGHSFTYDAENRLVNVNGNTYVYDAFGRRVKGPSGEVLYDLSGRPVTWLDPNNGNWNYGEVYAGGRHLATYSGGAGGSTNFLHSDWLGTKRVMTSVNQTVSETCTSLPFGDASSCAGTNVGYDSFTDDPHDSESNTEHTQFRQMSTTQGRWLAPDPYKGSMDVTNPQSLNRYAYVNNRAVNLTDPSGLDGGCGTPGGPEDCLASDGMGAGSNCTLNGITTDCGFAFGFVAGGGAAVCPNNQCNRAVWTNNQWLNQGYHAFTNGGGYYSFSGPGALYYTLESAGAAGANYFWNQSTAEKREYGGTIYQDQNGIFSFGAGQVGPPCSDDPLSGCEMNIDPTIRPDGSTLFGDYHTHPGLPGRGASDFSDTDIGGLVDASAWGFLSTAPAGSRILMFNPNQYAAWLNTGTGTPVCVLQGPNLGSTPSCH
jgi:RHS repeat-associated protein